MNKTDKIAEIEAERKGLKKLYDDFMNDKVTLSKVKGACAVSNEAHKKDCLLYKMKHNLG